MSPCCLLPIAGGCCWRSTSGGDKVTIASNTSSILHAGGADGRAITTCNRLEIVFTLQIKLLFAKPALKSDSRGFSKETADVPFLHTKEEDVTRVKKMCTTFYLQTRFDSLLAKEGFNGISNV